MITHAFRWGGMLAFLCICSHVRRYVPHMFSTWSHIASGDTGMLTSLCSCSHAVTFSACFWRDHIYVWQIEGKWWALAHMFDVTFHIVPHIFPDMITHIFGKEGDVNVFVHLLTWSMLRSIHRRDTITHTFGWVPDVNVFVHWLTCSMLHFTHVFDMITPTFGWGKRIDLVVHLLTCSMLRSTRSHIHLAGGGQCYRVHLLTCSMLRSTHLPDMITHTLRWRGMLTFLCTCSQVQCYAPHIFSTWSHIPSAERGKLTFLWTCYHLLTCAMLRSKRFAYMIVHIANISCYAPHACFFQFIRHLQEKW